MVALVQLLQAGDALLGRLAARALLPELALQPRHARAQRRLQLGCALGRAAVQRDLRLRVARERARRGCLRLQPPAVLVYRAGLGLNEFPGL